MKKTNWLTVTFIAIVAILILFWVGTTLAPGASAGVTSSWGGRGYRMMGGGYGMMGNRGFSPFGWFGMGLGMLFMWLIPIGIVALTIYGVAALVRNTVNNPPVIQATCPNCGKGTQTDWRNCPFCGTTLK